jgi:hypothetical protein
MKFYYSIIGGILGTLLMTLFSYFIAYITHKPTKVVKVLGTMLTNQTTPEGGLSNKLSAILIGILAHYLVGIGFTFIYFYLWPNRDSEASFFQSLLFGFLCGVFGIIVWKIFFLLHPNPPEISLPVYLLNILIGHLFFGIGIFITYKFIYFMIDKIQYN